MVGELDSPTAKEREGAIPTTLSRQNAQKISHYFAQILKKMGRLTVDLLIMEHDLDLVHLLVKILRQENSIYRQVPFIVLFSGKIDGAKMVDLS